MVGAGLIKRSVFEHVVSLNTTGVETGAGAGGAGGEEKSGKRLSVEARKKEAKKKKKEGKKGAKDGKKGKKEKKKKKGTSSAVNLLSAPLAMSTASQASRGSPLERDVAAAILHKLRKQGREKAGECLSNTRKKEARRPFKEIGSAHLVGIHLFVYCRADWVAKGRITDVQIDTVPTGLGGVYGNKGGVGVSFSLDGTTSMTFVGSHLAARATQKRLIERQKNVSIRREAERGWQRETEVERERQKRDRRRLHSESVVCGSWYTVP